MTLVLADKVTLFEIETILPPKALTKDAPATTLFPPKDITSLPLIDTFASIDD